MSYQPGKHLIATIETLDKTRLQQYQHCKECIDQLIERHGLQKLGEVYHNFLPQGFTGVVCLSESHISIHTWPEYGKVNMDVYLSNFMRSNDDTVEDIFHTLAGFFGSDSVTTQIITR